MRTLLEQSVLASIRASRRIVPGDRVGVAVSGGGDSLALLRLLDVLRGDLGITLLVVHFNHGLRGAESDQDASFVAEVARTHKFEFILGGEGVAKIASQNGWNLEDAGRRLRYVFFRRLVEDGRATRIAVAHTADDQAETVLAHILRGTGPAGLGGIHPAIGPVVRPLLEVRREEIRSYLREVGQTWCEDSTNKDLLRTRARDSGTIAAAAATRFFPAGRGPVVRPCAALTRGSSVLERLRGGPLSISRAFREWGSFHCDQRFTRASGFIAGRITRAFATRRKCAEFRAARDRAPDSQDVRIVARRLQRFRRRARRASHPPCDGVVERSPCATPRRHPCGEAVRRFGFLACNQCEARLANS